MPENIQPLSLEQAAAELGSAIPGRLDDRGFRIDDDDDKITSLVGDEDVGSHESETTDQDDPEDEIEHDAEEDSDQPDEPVVQTIDPPKSFTSEERDEFLKLPAAMQQTVARRESDRDKAVLQRFNDLATEKQQLQPLAQRLQQEQQNFQQLTNLVMQMGLPEAQEFQNVNWVELSRSLDPSSYAEKRARFEQFQQKLALVGQSVQQVQQQQQGQAAQVYQQAVNQELERLYEDMPELRDQTKAQALIGDIQTAMKDYGFSPDELNAVVDSRVVKVMADLAKMKQAESVRKSAMQKKTAQPAPRVMQPGGSNNREQNKTTKLKDAYSKLEKTGDIWDAVRVMTLQQ